MITGEKGSRLSKIARELNVGISTLVEFLHKQGIKISSDPNTKIEADVHELLEKQFRKDHEARIEADKVNLRHHRVKNESVSIEDIQVENKDSDESDADDDSVMIKDHSSHHYKEEKRPEPARPTPSSSPSPAPAPVPSANQPVSPSVPTPAPAPVSEIEMPKVKVVGQVDLESLKRKPKSKSEKPEAPPAEEKKNEEEKPATAAPAEVAPEHQPISKSIPADAPTVAPPTSANEDISTSETPEITEKSDVQPEHLISFQVVHQIFQLFQAFLMC